MSNWYPTDESDPWQVSDDIGSGFAQIANNINQLPPPAPSFDFSQIGNGFSNIADNLYSDVGNAFSSIANGYQQPAPSWDTGNNSGWDIGAGFNQAANNLYDQQGGFSSWDTGQQQPAWDFGDVGNAFSQIANQQPPNIYDQLDQQNNNWNWGEDIGASFGMMGNQADFWTQPQQPQNIYDQLDFMQESKATQPRGLLSYLGQGVQNIPPAQPTNEDFSNWTWEGSGGSTDRRAPAPNWYDGIPVVGGIASWADNTFFKNNNLAYNPAFNRTGYIDPANVNKPLDPINDLNTWAAGFNNRFGEAVKPIGAGFDVAAKSDIPIVAPVAGAVQNYFENAVEPVFNFTSSAVGDIAAGKVPAELANIPREIFDRDNLQKEYQQKLNNILQTEYDRVLQETGDPAKAEQSANALNSKLSSNFALLSQYEGQQKFSELPAAVQLGIGLADPVGNFGGEFLLAGKLPKPLTKPGAAKLFKPIAESGIPQKIENAAQYIAPIPAAGKLADAATRYTGLQWVGDKLTDALKSPQQKAAALDNEISRLAPRLEDYARETGIEPAQAINDFATNAETRANMGYTGEYKQIGDQIAQALRENFNESKALQLDLDRPPASEDYRNASGLEQTLADRRAIADEQAANRALTPEAQAEAERRAAYQNAYRAEIADQIPDSFIDGANGQKLNMKGIQADAQAREFIEQVYDDPAARQAFEQARPDFAPKVDAELARVKAEQAATNSTFDEFFGKDTATQRDTATAAQVKAEPRPEYLKVLDIPANLDTAAPKEILDFARQNLRLKTRANVLDFGGMSERKALKASGGQLDYSMAKVRTARNLEQFGAIGSVLRGTDYPTKFLSRAFLGNVGRLVKDPGGNIGKAIMSGFNAFGSRKQTVRAQKLGLEFGNLSGSMSQDAPKAIGTKSKFVNLGFTIINPLNEAVNFGLRQLEKREVKIKGQPIKPVNELVEGLETSIKTNVATQAALEYFDSNAKKLVQDEVKAGRLPASLADAVTAETITPEQLTNYAAGIMPEKANLADQTAGRYNAHNISPEIADLRTQLDKSPFAGVTAPFDKLPKEAKPGTPAWEAAEKEARTIVDNSYLAPVQQEAAELANAKADPLTEAVIKDPRASRPGSPADTRIDAAIAKVWQPKPTAPNLSGIKFPSFLQRVLEDKQAKLETYYQAKYGAPEQKPSVSTKPAPTFEELVRNFKKNNPGATLTDFADYYKDLQQQKAAAKQPAPAGRTVTRQATAEVTASSPSDPNKQYNFTVKVVPLDSLIPSHTDNLAVNLKFPGLLQPRLRDRIGSKLQIGKIAAKLNPDALLKDTGQIDRGAPIIGNDRIVESGNGRTLALRRARVDFPQQWQDYQTRLREVLPEYGIDPATVKGIKDPVLVRERTTLLTDQERISFTKEANEGALLQASPLEQALSDAGRITDEAISALEVPETASIDAALTSPSNRDFVRSFMESLPANERAALLTSTGQLNAAGLRRIKSGLFAKVYPGEAGTRLTAAFTESIDPAVKNVESAMFASLPRMSRAEGLIKQGLRDSNLSIAGDMAAATDVLARLRQQGVKVADYLGQANLFERELTPFQEKLLSYLDQNGRSPKAMREFLNDYADAIDNSPNPQQGSLFDDVKPPTKEEITNVLFRKDTGAELPAATTPAENTATATQEAVKAQPPKPKAAQTATARKGGKELARTGEELEATPPEDKAQIVKLYNEIYNPPGASGILAPYTLRRLASNWSGADVAARRRYMADFLKADENIRFVTGNEYKLDPRTFEPVRTRDGRNLKEMYFEATGKPLQNKVEPVSTRPPDSVLLDDAKRAELLEQSREFFGEDSTAFADMQEALEQVKQRLGEKATQPFSQMQPLEADLIRSQIARDILEVDPLDNATTREQLDAGRQQALDYISKLREDATTRAAQPPAPKANPAAAIEAAKYASQLRQRLRLEASRAGAETASKLYFDYSQKNIVDQALSNWLPFNYWARKNFVWAVQHMAAHPMHFAALLNFYKQNEEQNRKRGIPDYARSQIFLWQNPDGSKVLFNPNAFLNLNPFGEGDSAMQTISAAEASTKPTANTNPLLTLLIGQDKPGGREKGLLSSFFRPNPILDTVAKTGVITDFYKQLGVIDKDGKLFGLPGQSYFGSAGDPNKQTLGLIPGRTLIQSLTSLPIGDKSIAQSLRDAGLNIADVDLEGLPNELLFGKLAGKPVGKIQQELTRQVQLGTLSQEEALKALADMKEGKWTPATLKALDAINAEDLPRRLSVIAGFAATVTDTPRQQTADQLSKGYQAVADQKGYYTDELDPKTGKTKKVYHPGGSTQFFADNPGATVLFSGNKSADEIRQGLKDDKTRQAVNDLYAQREAKTISTRDYNAAMDKLKADNPSYFTNQQASKLGKALGFKELAPGEERPDLKKMLTDFQNEGANRKYNEQLDDYRRIGGDRYNELSQQAAQLSAAGDKKAAAAIYNSKEFKDLQQARDAYLKANPDFAARYNQGIAEKYGKQPATETDKQYNDKLTQYYNIGGDRYNQLTDQYNKLKAAGKTQEANAILNSSEYQRIRQAREQFLNDNPDFGEKFKADYAAKYGKPYQPYTPYTPKASTTQATGKGGNTGNYTRSTSGSNYTQRTGQSYAPRPTYTPAKKTSYAPQPKKSYQPAAAKKQYTPAKKLPPPNIYTQMGLQFGQGSKYQPTAKAPAPNKYQPKQTVPKPSSYAPRQTAPNLPLPKKQYTPKPATAPRRLPPLPTPAPVSRAEDVINKLRTSALRGQSPAFPTLPRPISSFKLKRRF